MDLTCDEVEPMIGFLLDNELDQAQSLDVEAHLETCDGCRQVLEDEGNLRDVLRRAAASVDTPKALRNRIRVTMERERRSQIGLARAWPAAVAAAILVSFVWRGAPVSGPMAQTQLSQAHVKDIAMDVTSADPVVVAHYLRTQLSFVVPIETFAQNAQGQKPVTIAARVVDENGQQAAFLRLTYAQGAISLVVRHADAKPSGVQQTQAQWGASSPWLTSADAAPAVYVAQDAAGLTVAQWQTQGLVYDMVCDLPKAEALALMHRCLQAD